VLVKERSVTGMGKSVGSSFLLGKKFTWLLTGGRIVDMEKALKAVDTTRKGWGKKYLRNGRSIKAGGGGGAR